MHKIVQEEFQPVPEWLSQEFKNLLVTMLLKADEDRPTTRNILDMPLIEKYMKDFLQQKEKTVQGADDFESRAEATAKLQRAAKSQEQPMLTPKQKLQLKKQREVEKKFKELSLAAKDAGQIRAE